MSNQPLPDAAARRLMAEELGMNFLVEAGAGSGKTTQMVRRMLALVRTGTATVDQIAAITFTRKAAAHLRERFQVKLEIELAQAQDGPDREHLATALRDVDRGFIGTIHSFASRLVRERAVEAGVDPAFVELEGPEERLLEQQCWLEYLERVRTAGAGNLRPFEIDPATLFGLFRQLAGSPDVRPSETEVDAPDLAAIGGKLTAFLVEAQDRLPDRVPDGGWDDLQSLLRKATRLHATLDAAQPHQVMRVLKLLDRSSVKAVQKKWQSKELAKEAEGWFAAFRDAQVVPALTRWREHIHPHMIRFVMPAVRYYAERRRALCVMNFADLLMTATAMLRSRPAVRAYFAKRYTRLLVDEFQDTDPIQAELVMLLAGQDAAETNWRKVKPRLGSLFVVGDPRQSIYRFRRADIAVYQQFKELIVGTGGQVLMLTANFRSVAAIGKWVNPVFAQLFPEAADRYQAAYGEMATVHDDPPGHLQGLYKITVPKIPYNKKDEIAAHDAAQIARYIAWACQGNVTLQRTDDERRDGIGPTANPGDFLILSYQKERLSVYARALERYGIPYTVTGGKGFGEEVAIEQLLIVLQAVADPDDSIALTGALRGLYFGFADDLLYRFVREGGRLHYRSPQPDRVKGTAEFAPMLGALEQLHTYWEEARSLPPAVAVERVVTDLGIIPYALSGEMGNSRAGNLLKVLELFRRVGAPSLGAAIAQVQTLLEVEEIEEGQVGPPRRDAVQLMNLHKAKGLEAHVVFLVDPGKRASHEPQAHVKRDGADSVGYYLINGDDGFRGQLLAQPPDWSKLAAEEARFGEAEGHRLLYVAATRAHSALVISQYPEKEEGPWAALSPWLGDVPELPDVAVSPVGRPPATVNVAELEATLTVVASARATAAETAYTAERVTDVAHGVEAPPWQETEHGLSWGSAVHRLFEWITKGGTDLPTLARKALVESGRDGAEVDELVAVAEAWLASDLGGRAARAAERYAEVPINAVVDGVLLSGTIDLAIREAGGWVLVDYKTDRMAEADLDAFVRYYALQITTYSRMWAAATGAPVEGCYLYFTHLERAVRI